MSGGKIAYGWARGATFLAFFTTNSTFFKTRGTRFLQYIFGTRSLVTFTLTTSWSIQRYGVAYRLIHFTYLVSDACQFRPEVNRIRSCSTGRHDFRSSLLETHTRLPESCRIGLVEPFHCLPLHSLLPVGFYAEYHF